MINTAIGMKTVNNLNQMQEFAKEFAKGLKQPACIALYGDLGVGKTEFVRAAITEIVGAVINVPSPTFTIVQEYEGFDFPIYHFDLYRIKDVSELEEIGFFEAIDKGIVFIEWPDRAGQFLPNNAIKIEIKHGDGENREILVNNPIKPTGGEAPRTLIF
jgi:tRNA threonylcarbamoyl adenosine modification protein YjeE